MDAERYLLEKETKRHKTTPPTTTPTATPTTTITKIPSHKKSFSKSTLRIDIDHYRESAHVWPSSGLWKWGGVSAFWRRWSGSLPQQIIRVSNELLRGFSIISGLLLLIAANKQIKKRLLQLLTVRKRFFFAEYLVKSPQHICRTYRAAYRLHGMHF